jgi:mRNA interferase HigB
MEGLKQAIKLHPDCAEAALSWYRVAKKSDWSSFSDVRQSISSVDRVGNVLIFNLRGNAYRLIVRANFPGRKLFVKALLSHTEYDRKEWMKWA